MFPLILGAFFAALELGAAVAEGLSVFMAAETAGALATAGTAYVAKTAGEKLDEKLYEEFQKHMADQQGPELNEDLMTRLAKFMMTKDPKAILEFERQRQAAAQPAPTNQPAQTNYGTQPGQGLIVQPTNSPAQTNYGTQPGQGLVVNPTNNNEPAQPTQYIDPMLPKTEQVRLQEAPVVESFRNSLATVGDQFDSKQQGPRDLARLLIDSSKELVKTGNPVQATLNVLETNPQAFSLMSKVTGFLANKSLPNTEEYKKIAAVYNGRNIDYSNFSIARNPRTGLIEVTGTDETGEAFTLPQTTGVVLPAVPGTVFMGPLSANDQLPTEGRVEDYFSFFHDYSWKDGNFNRVGDLQFISRLSQNRDRVKPEHRKLVDSTIIYFTNVSLTLGLLKNQKLFATGEETPQEVAEYAQTDGNGEDIFDVLGMVDKSAAMRSKKD